jgi:DNA-binding NtrC family response regulator
MAELPNRLLVVDDDTSLLQLLQKYLTRLGYEVETCTGGGQAWRQFETQPDRFSLVLADLTLDDMPGEELLIRILTLRPLMPVLVCSGYPFNVEKLGTPSSCRVAFLQKPFVPKMLAEAVEGLLGQRIIS